MSNIDLLLGLDADKLAEVPVKDLKMPRLSRLTGADFIVRLRAIPAKRFTELASGIRNKNGVVDTASAYEANIKIAVAGLIDPSMKDKALMDKFKCSTPAQLAEAIFTGGEISAMADAVTELSGFGGNAVEEIKN